MVKRNQEFSKEVVIVNQLGLHARSAAKIAKLAKHAKSTIWVIKDRDKVDASSIIDVLTLACPKGSKIELSADSQVDIDIINDIIALIERGFEE
ncbi:MAG: HPr family phosphocarrier protein [Desulfobacterales bacterium]|nr:HPr family phosphocarrier protein [Deltaproteobacteria bacterium]NNL43365.1 HPr family phosphocarrier protein [Desulfobacterales bacterium]